METSYVFHRTELVVEQLRRLSETFDPLTTERLVGIGVGAGWRCLEVGAGNGSIARFIAEQVGPSGQVVATDIDTTYLVPHPRVEIREHNIIVDPLEEAAYDLIHARLVLIHQPGAEKVLARLVDALRPGGWLLVEDFDAVFPPPTPMAQFPEDVALHRRITNGIRQLVTIAGGDVSWGSRAYAAARRLGLVDVTATIRADAWAGGTVGCLAAAIFAEQLRDKMVAAHLATDDDITRFGKLAQDPNFAVTHWPMVSTSARKPGRAGTLDN